MNIKRKKGYYIGEIRHRKKLKRKKTQSYTTNSEYIKKCIISFQDSSTSKIYRFLKESSFLNQEYKELKLTAPKFLSLEENHDKTVLFLKKIISSIYFEYENRREDLVIDFSNCENIGLGVIIIINSFLYDFLKFRRKLAGKSRLSFDNLNKVEIKGSKYDEANNKLLLIQYPVKFPIPPTETGIKGFRLMTGEKKLKITSSNSKAAVCKKIRGLVNYSLRSQKYKLTLSGEKLFDNVIGEILSNSEDHGITSKWFTHTSFRQIKSNEKNINQINLVFLNYGPSLYEGALNSKDKNIQTFKEVDMMSEAMLTKAKDSKLTKESLSSFYYLQEGFSRLKHEGGARGTGTMTFIRSFMDLGDFNDSNCEPMLYLLSGHTLIKCDKNHRPHKEGDKHYLSLNTHKSLSYPPDESHLITQKEKFPGTILFLRLFLNSEHLKTKPQYN